MKNKVIFILLALTMVGNTTLADASTGSDSNNCVKLDIEKNAKDEEVADYVENVLGIDNLNAKISENRDFYIVDGGDFDISIPKTGNDPVIISCEGRDISMLLPEEIADVDSKISEKGTVAYESDENDFSVAVQALIYEQEGIEFESVRVLMTIENPNAPTEYSFKYNLPKGFSLVSDYNYDDDWDGGDCGAVYIVDKQNEIAATIEPAWAVDANGEKVESYYTIKGTTLIQKVKIDDTTAFPILADPTEHPTKYTKMYYTRNDIDEIMDHYTGAGLGSIVSASVSGIASVVGFFVNSIVGVVSSGIGTIWSCITISGTIYNSTQYATWKKIRTGLINSGKTYALVKYPWTWHQGHRSYYPHGNLSASYSNTISS